MSASAGVFDMLYGYQIASVAMTMSRIETVIDDFGKAARRVATQAVTVS